MHHVQAIILLFIIGEQVRYGVTVSAKSLGSQEGRVELLHPSLYP